MTPRDGRERKGRERIYIVGGGERGGTWQNQAVEGENLNKPLEPVPHLSMGGDSLSPCGVGAKQIGG